jgi:hypothetical protein
VGSLDFLEQPWIRVGCPRVGSIDDELHLYAAALNMQRKLAGQEAVLLLDRRR